MPEVPDLEEVRKGLEAALQTIPQDRWLLAGLRDGRLKVIAESRQSPLRPAARRLELSATARRCLYERRPLAVSTLSEIDLSADNEDWELEWPALLYAPVGIRGTRPVGLLVVGSRRSYWYDQEEVDYVASLAITLTTFVAAATGPLGRLQRRELQAAQLMGEGLSDAEIARGLNIQRREARELVNEVLQKLSLRSRHEVRDVFPERPPSRGGPLI